MFSQPLPRPPADTVLPVVLHEVSVREAVCLTRNFPLKEVFPEVPIYEFKCLDCSGVSEVFVRSNEQVLTCPDCGSDNLEKLMSSSYVVRTTGQISGTTCCGRSERCEAPPCSSGDTCRRQ